MNYYNEFDPYAAQWLRNLIAAGAIPPGHVDQRSITEVKPENLAGFTQCHFFAGIAGWSLALKLAGIDPSTPLWTGSCPCQPFSAAGKRKGTEDERHLWPIFRDLIAQCKPPIVFGEQVASADGKDWLSTVRAEMEALAYAVGAADLCAAGVGAPHIRQRLYFVGLADTHSQFHNRCGDAGQGGRDEYSDGSADGGVAHSNHPRPQGSHGKHAGPQERENTARHPGPLRDTSWLANTESKGSSHRRAGEIQPIAIKGGDLGLSAKRPSPTDGFWSDADWLFCRDGKWRPVEPGTFPLAHGIPNRVGRLRAYGNAIVPKVAATFIRAALAERKTD